jgi:phosphohistidine phosphatase
MRLLIVRHADAGDREEFAQTGQPDSERPLSPKGVSQMERDAPALKLLVGTVDAIVTSPYVRARQTAEILRREFATGPLLETDTLQPESKPRAFERFLRGLEGDVVVCVGHEPHLGELVGWLTTGNPASFLDFRKGGACLVRFDGRPGRGKATLRWLFGPRDLKRLH